MLALAAAVASFLALSAAAVALVGARRTPLDQRVLALAPPDAASEGHATVRHRSRSFPAGLRSLLARSRRGEALDRELRQAGIGLRASEFVLARWLLVTIAVAVPVLIGRLHPASIAIGAIAAAAAYLLPGVYVRSARRRRVARIERQLAELLPLLASALRSGFALQQGIESASRQLGAPLADELAVLLRDLSLGATMQDALEDVRERVGSPDLDVVVTAMLVQRNTGANLADVLDQATETLIERERIRGEVHTLTAQQRLTGTILSIYPVAVGLLLLAMMPAIWSRLFTEPLGQAQLAVALGLQVSGVFAIRRAVNIEY